MINKIISEENMNKPEKKLLQSIIMLLSDFKFPIFKKSFNRSKIMLWLMEFNVIKGLALFVINCILLSFVYGQAVAIVAENVRSTEQFKQIFEDFTLPYSYGKIVDANYAGSDTVIINIQDLHLHPQAQKNEANIISVFDKAYGVKDIYLEGVYGQLDTSWLANINNSDSKEKTVDSIFETGILTGAEYYSIQSNRTKLIKGLETKDPYLQNLKRFGDILLSQGKVSSILKSMDENITYLKSQYFNRTQRKIEEISKSYLDGNMESVKYYTLMLKHTEKLGIDINKYRNISMYMELIKEGKQIDYSRSTKELEKFVLKLKDILPYAVYEMLLEYTANFRELDKLYTYLVKLSKENHIDLSVSFPELNKFLGYIELSQKINPLEMLKEENRLTNEINTAFAADQGARDIVFLAGFVKYLGDYLSGKITSDDYMYYQANIQEFKRLWVKYIDNQKLELLAPYESIVDAFYDVNVNRNQYFIDNIDGIKNAGKITSVYPANLSQAEKVIKSLKEAKNISVVLTGGFHTQGVSDLLAKNGISYIVIMPNVSGDVKVAQEVYYVLAKEQSKMLFQALAVEPISLMNATQRLVEIATVFRQKGFTLETINEYFRKINVKAAVSGDINTESGIKLSVTGEDG
ncbi:MAG: hypothetical protein LBQ13_00765, partial [Endomicrobium sp.]|nr:hypothetical protein [Endomicrobium sp.]